MVPRASKFFRFPAVLFAAAALPLVQVPLHAQAPPPAHPAQFDPSAVYFQGYLAVRAAEQLERDEDFSAAWEKLEQAKKLFESVRKFYPDWKPEMVTGRAEKTLEMLDIVRPKAEAQQLEEKSVIAELEGGLLSGGRLLDPGEDSRLNPGILEIDPMASRRLAEAEAEVQRLKNLIADAQITPTEASRNASRVRDLDAARQASEARLRAAEAQLQSLRARLAASPVEDELKGINKRISDLEQEREAMIMALNQSRDQHTRAMSKIAILEADLRAMTTQATELRQREADLQRDLTTEREAASEVVEAQQQQLRDLEQLLDGKTAELANARETISALQIELRQTRDAFAELRDERDVLLQEHSHMSALLKLDEDGRLQVLIEQNMDLAKQLREAGERVERLNLDGNADKDSLLHAKRDLAVAKRRITDLQDERRAQDRHLAELEARLRREDGALADGRAALNPAEADELREIIRRQLRVQERRKQAREILVEAVKELGAEDERVAAAIRLFDGEEVHLTPEEQSLLADRKVDGEFISPVARNREAVVDATAELNRNLDTYSRVAEKAFVSGRLGTTRDLFQMMVELNPGHTPALCKLGFVHFRMEDFGSAADTFRRAVEMDDNNPYAHRMLGESLMRLGDLAAAEEPIRRSTELSPELASSHTLLAEITFQLGRIDEAEEHCRAAILADPMPSEPYFNLAMLHARKGELDEAQAFYRQALDRGALPDPALEERIYPPQASR